MSESTETGPRLAWAPSDSPHRFYANAGPFLIETSHGRYWWIHLGHRKVAQGDLGRESEVEVERADGRMGWDCGPDEAPQLAAEAGLLSLLREAAGALALSIGEPVA